ncbi:MAG TPA: DUF6662 family protein [Gemmatimonadales bacterium]|nr:DUF6662 family protein [Gemmatimonadales bacterium]
MRTQAFRRSRGLIALGIGCVAGLTSWGARALAAQESAFGYVITTDLLPKGAREIQQAVTWRHEKIAGYFDGLDFRTEIEYGLTSRLQAALELNYSWNQAYHNGPLGATTPAEPFSYDHPDPDAHYSATRFVGVSGELTYTILSPYTDPFGLALYEDLTGGPQFFESETKLILQKNFLDDLLTFAFNFTYAPELRYFSPEAETPSWQEETDVNAYFGVTYRFHRNWWAGLEFLNEREYNSYDFTEWTNSGYYVGPSFHYGGKTFFAAIVFLEQLPWATVHEATLPGAVVDDRVYDNDFERYRVRLRVGFYP